MLFLGARKERKFSKVNTTTWTCDQSFLDHDLNILHIPKINMLALQDHLAFHILPVDHILSSACSHPCPKLGLAMWPSYITCVSQCVCVVRCCLALVRHFTLVRVCLLGSDISPARIDAKCIRLYCYCSLIVPVLGCRTDIGFWVFSCN